MPWRCHQRAEGGDRLRVLLWAPVVAVIAVSCGGTTQDRATGVATSPRPLASAERGTDHEPTDRVLNLDVLSRGEQALVAGLLDDPWVAGVAGPLTASVAHRGGRSLVSLRYEAPRDARRFRFDHDGCGIQPDVVTGVRFLLEPSRARPGEPWAAKSFEWESESGDLESCVALPPQE